jgi:hypothetical protein
MRIPVLLTPTESDPNTPLVYTTEDEKSRRLRQIQQEEIRRIWADPEPEAQGREAREESQISQRSDPPRRSQKYDSLRGKGIAEILQHLINHAENMKVKEIRKEIGKIIQSHISQNNLSPVQMGHVIHKVEGWFVKEDNHPRMMANLVSFALWLEEMSAEGTRAMAERVEQEHKETQKMVKNPNTPSSLGVEFSARQIIMTLHYDYGMDGVDLDMQGGKVRVLVGQNHKRVRWDQAAGLAKEYEDEEGIGISVWVDNGPVKGRVRWLDSQQDSIALVAGSRIGESGGYVFLSVYEILPYLLRKAGPLVRSFSPEKIKGIMQLAQNVHENRPDRYEEIPGIGNEGGNSEDENGGEQEQSSQAILEHDFLAQNDKEEESTISENSEETQKEDNPNGNDA